MATRKETKVFRSRKDSITAILNEKTCFPCSFFEGHFGTYVKLKELKNLIQLLIISRFKNRDMQIKAKL